MKKTIFILCTISITFLSCGDLGITIPTEVESVTLTTHTSQLLLLERQQLQAIVLPNNAEYTLNWTSSNEAIASVDAQGIVSTHKIGSTYIKVAAGNKMDSCLITVVKVDIPFTQGEIAKITQAPYDNSNYAVKDLYLYEEGVDVLDWTGSGYFTRIKLVVPASETNALQTGTYALKNITDATELEANAIIAGSYNAGGSSQSAKYINSWLYEAKQTTTNYVAPITNGYLTVMKDYDSYIMIGELEFSFLNSDGQVFQTLTYTVNFTGEVPINLTQNMPKNTKILGDYTEFDMKKLILKENTRF